MTSSTAQERYEEQKRKKEQIKQATNTIMDLAKYQNEHANISSILSQLQDVVKRENKRHMMDQHLSSSMLSLLEEEIIPLLENELDYDPTPQHLYDNTGGESTINTAETHAAAWRQHQELHR